ncbi:hypothetical protein [Janthinobacterium sp. MDT1-19]|uniref:hypothetical protein n=1 Tax=Janthinobacterium sp. MDT1-19 TaxID=1259339 RepID=UPI003F297F75
MFKTYLTSPRKLAGAIAILSGLATSVPAHAQWAVFDAAGLMEAIVQELNQLEQIANANIRTMQQLKDYRLQLQNLQQLPGNLRREVQSRLQRQLLNNVRDFGRSIINKQNTQDPHSATYYTNAEDITTMTIGSVPRTSASISADLTSIGMNSNESVVVRGAQLDRMQYERVADDIRHVALTRQNAEDRATQANTVAEQMATLADNNTVGAIQLLSAQNSLAYAQQEDLGKTQAAILKNQQEMQLRELAEREGDRKAEIERLRKVRAEAQSPRASANMIP